MENRILVNFLLFVGILLLSIGRTQQQLSSITNKNVNKFPSYSLQNMPQTDFSCRDKILGGYYADAETQCQMFHVCVKVAGVGVQDFRFLCPNGTAFDQEAQTCADWGDVDCEQATLYYGSDNFDLYRIGSGFENKRAPFAEEQESTFHLQRAESSDARRSKEVIVNQSNYGAASAYKKQQILLDDVSIRPAKQYQPQKFATAATKSYPIDPRRTSSTTQAYITNKPTPVLAQQQQLPQQQYSISYNNNDDIFKGSHSSNFYSSRNSNRDDDEDYKQASTGSTKSRQRQRGRSHYRGTPPTTSTATTLKPYFTYTSSASPNFNLTTSTARAVFTSSTPSPFFTAQSTTFAPFKFTFAPTVRANQPQAIAGAQTNNFIENANNFNANSNSNNFNQISSSTPLGPLQQQYQQPNYNNNFGSFKPTTLASSAAITTTTASQKFLQNNFNNILSTPPTFDAPPIPVVSVPTPFNFNNKNSNSNFNNNNNNYFTNSNSGFSNNNNNHLFNGNQHANQANFNNNNNNHKQIGKTFDNNNPINNYQTTSPFTNQQPIYNQKPLFASNNNQNNNNNGTKLAPALQATQSNHFTQQSKQVAFNQQPVNNESTYQQQQQQQQQRLNFNDLRLASSTTPHSAIPHTQIPRRPFNEEPPNFKQQDYLNQYNTEQQRIAQNQNQFLITERNLHNSRRPEPQSRIVPDRQLDQKRLQLHYDINDYLTTSKYTTLNQYSPTSEQYRSEQPYQAPSNQKQYQTIDQTFRGTAQNNQKALESFTQKYNSPNGSSQTLFSFTTTTAATSRQPYEPYKQYQAQQRQQQQQQKQAQPSQKKQPIIINRSPNLNADVSSQLTQPKSAYSTQIHRQPLVSSTTPPPSVPALRSTDNSIAQPPVKKFSTLVPKEYYAPTTFKPFLYYNVAKQINDNLNTASKYSTSTLPPSTSTTTVRTISNSTPQNRYSLPSSNVNYQHHPIQQQQYQPIAQTSKITLDGIDEDDGQYHPELYEQDFARYKIKNKKKQHQKQQQQKQRNQNNLNNGNIHFSNNNYQANGDGLFNAQTRFQSSNEEELLSTAHSQNIAASGNELRATNAKIAANTKQSSAVNNGGAFSTKTASSTTKLSLPKALSNAPTIPPNATTKKSTLPVDDKDVSYDYAYYDSANDTPHEYSEIDISDFGKTRKHQI